MSGQAEIAVRVHPQVTLVRPDKPEPWTECAAGWFNIGDHDFGALAGPRLEERIHLGSEGGVETLVWHLARV
jgi:hypothetical protein